MNEPADKTRIKRIIGAICGVVLGIVISQFVHIDGLGQQGVTVLAILAGAIVWWICDVLPEFATALLMVVLFVLFGGISLQTAFVTFSNSTWWLLVAAFALGLGMRETGLLKRMALAIVSRFPASFAAQVAGFIACGTVLGPLIPSMAAKVSILSPLAMQIGDDLGYERRGRESNGLFLAMFTGVQNVAPAVISASVIGYALLALYPADIQTQFNLVNWFLASLPWFIPMTLLNFAGIMLMYGLRRKRQTPAADCADGDLLGETRAEDAFANLHEDIMEERHTLGSMDVQEKRMAIIMVVTVGFWVTQALHGIPAWIVAVCALVAMVACGIVNKSNFASGISWSSLVFIGVILGLGDVFAEAGINEWIVMAFTPALSTMATNPFLFVAGIAIITVIARFLVVSQIAFLNIFMAFAIPIALTLGINPWVVGFASYAVISPWFVKYQNPIYLAAYYSVDGKMVKHSEMAKYCVVYTLISIGCLLIAVPFWQMMGML